jgi:hypothetical protein
MSKLYNDANIETLRMQGLFPGTHVYTKWKINSSTLKMADKNLNLQKNSLQN